MLPRIVDARCTTDRGIWLRLADGTKGKVDVFARMHGKVVEALRNFEVFKVIRLHPEQLTVV